MRILVLTNLYPRPHHETLAPFNRQQFHALVPEHEVRIIAPVSWTEEIRDRLHGRGTISPRLTDDGVTVEHPLFFFPPKIVPHLYGTFFLQSVRNAFRRAVREFRPDLILAAWAHPDGWAAVKLAREAKLPCVIKVHGSDVLINAKSGRRRIEISSALRQADRVLVVSQDLAKRVVDLGVNPERIVVLLEGLDGSAFVPGSKVVSRLALGIPVESRQILFVGNLLLTKGLGVLVQACKILVNQGVVFECRLVGRGRDETRIRNLVAAAGLNGQMLFMGPRPHRELPDWYRASDLLVLPSFSEGIPNVLRESVACGCPYVATTVGGIPEISNPQASILVEPRDPVALATAMRMMLDSSPTSERVQATARHVTWSETAQQLTEVFHLVTQSKEAAGL